jgi:8-oxo-dGTP pyrophosphatase MutT (NUDIX family)
MTKLYGILVKVVYRLTWPFTGLILHNSNRVRIYLVADGKLLLQKTSYSSQHWSLPGGGIDKNELPVLAAQRELAEEAGIKLDRVQFKSIGQARVPLSGKSWPVMNITFYFVELPKLQHISTPRPLEIIGLKWFELSKLPSNLSHTVRLAQELLENNKSI